MKFLLTIVCALAFIGWAITRVVFGVAFDTGCDDYISQAASSPDPAIAASRLDAAISYAESHNLTSGNTGIFITYPTNDIGFWYKRMVDSRAILRALPPTDTPLEISNTMMRVRETLVEGGKNGDSTVAPGDISIYPSNAAFFWWGWLSILGTILFGIWAVVTLED